MPSFQVYSKSRKYGGNCTQCLASEFSGSGWIFGNGFNAFTWFWRLRTSKNQVSTILTTPLCPQLQVYNVHQSVELCTRTSKVCCWLWTPKLYFCNGSDDICHEVFEGWSWIYFENWEISSVFMQKYFLTWRLSSSFPAEVNKCGSRFKTTTILMEAAKRKR